MTDMLSLPNELGGNPFLDLIARASLTVHYDSDLSPAIKFGLTREIREIRKLAGQMEQWREKDADLLIKHIRSIYRLSPVVAKYILQNLIFQFPDLLPDGASTRLLKGDVNHKQANLI